MSLNSPAITELTVESGTYRVLNEWLSGFFDGGPHAVGTNAPQVFPLVNLGFGQGKPQPLTPKLMAGDPDTEIRTVMLSRGEEALPANTVLYNGLLVTDYVTLNFWVRSKRQGRGESEAAAQSVGELLKSLLGNPDARYPLAEKGLAALTPQGPPQWLPSTDYAMRMLACNAQLLYAVQYGAQAIVTVDTPQTPIAATEMKQFVREAPLIQGTYLMGYYQWPGTVKVNRAHVVGSAPQTQAVTLELELGGTLTGNQVVLPAGAANVEVSVETVFASVKIPPGQAVRWKVVSAPIPELTAYNTVLGMEIQSG